MNPMTRTTVVCAGAAAVLFAALAAGPGARLQAQAAEDPQKGAALLAEARKAIGGDDKLRAVKTLQSKPGPGGLRTVLRYQEVGGVRYFDAAGFPGRTVGVPGAQGPSARP